MNTYGVRFKPGTLREGPSKSFNLTHQKSTSQKNIINWHNKIHIIDINFDANFDVKYEGHQNCSKNTFHAHFEGFLVTIICDVKIGHQYW